MTRDKDDKALAHLCFWLPVGRSVFGFQGSDDEPLAVKIIQKQDNKMKEVDNFESNITSRVQHIISKLDGYGQIVFRPDLEGNSDPLGRRYIIIPVTKTIANVHNDIVVHLFSNGLCAVRFHAKKKINQRIIQKSF